MNTIDRIVFLRKRAGLSQPKLAEKIGVSKGNVGDWETGRSKPGSDALIMLSKVFDVSIDWILTGEERGPKTETEHKADIEEQPIAAEGVIEYKSPEKKVYEIDVDEEEKEILEMYRQFSNDAKMEIQMLMKVKLEYLKKTGKGRSSAFRNGEDAATSEKMHA